VCYVLFDFIFGFFLLLLFLSYVRLCVVFGGVVGIVDFCGDFFLVFV